MRPAVISFYTIDTPYEEEAKRLASSCASFGIECQIEGIVSRGSWEKNCAFKPSFILRKIRELKRPVVWIDADARFKASPSWDRFSSCDIALRMNPHLHRAHSAFLMTGTIFVNPTPRALKLLEEWEAACGHLDKEGGISCWDQVILARLLEKRTDVCTEPMPFSYVKTCYWDEGLISTEETIIEHGQATREMPQPSDIDEQKNEFREKRKAADCVGVIDYDPSMLRQAGDCCFSLLPFVSSLVVIMQEASYRSQEERRQFAFLARLFPFAHFIELSSACTNAMDIAKLFSNSENALSLSANQVVDRERMVGSLMRGEFALHRLPWRESKSEINVLRHPYFSQPMAKDPANLVKIDAQRLEQIEVALHLGLPLKP